MKIALCISGQMRTYRECYKNLKKYIIESYDTDIFIHTWSDSGNTTKSKKNIKGWEVTYEELEKLYKPKKVIIEEFKKEYFDNIEGINVPKLLKKTEPIHYKGNLPMFYKMYKCNELKKEYEKENNFKYDIVIRIRPDLLIQEELPDYIFKNNNIIWFNFANNGIGSGIGQISDKFALGGTEEIDYYTSVFKKLNQYWENPLGNGEWWNYKVGERLMQYHLINGNYKFKEFFSNFKLNRNLSLIKQISNFFNISKFTNIIKFKN